jgi:DNA-directed RNA polymerase subunit M/transcription elongation factor TFIIS
MAIQFACQCGKTLKAAEEHAGKRAKCNQCGTTVTIPGAKKAVANAVPAPKVSTVAAVKKTVPAVAAQSDLGDFLSTEIAAAKEAEARKCPGCKNPLSSKAVICMKCGYNLKTGQNMNVYAPSQTVKTKRSRRPSAFKAFFVSRLTSGKLWSGVGMMVGAAVWFVAGLAINRIFIYPPILFILGIISFFTGLIDGDTA